MFAILTSVSSTAQTSLVILVMSLTMFAVGKMLKTQGKDEFANNNYYMLGSRKTDQALGAAYHF